MIVRTNVLENVVIKSKKGKHPGQLATARYHNREVYSSNLIASYYMDVLILETI